MSLNSSITSEYQGLKRKKEDLYKLTKLKNNHPVSLSRLPVAKEHYLKPLSKSYKTTINIKIHNSSSDPMHKCENERKSKPKPETIAEFHPRSHSSDASNLCNIDKQELLDDFSKCGGNLKKLKEQIKNKKKNLNSKNESDKNKVEQIKDFIKNANFFVQNVSKIYTEKFRKSIDSVKSNIQFQDVESKISNNECSSINFVDDSHSNLNNSENIYSAERQETNSEIVEINQNFLPFSHNLSLETIENDYNCENNNIMNLNEQQIDQIQIINDKFKQKDKEFSFVIENFNLLLEKNDENTNISKKEDIVNEYMQREIQLKNNLLKLTSILKAKDSENMSLQNSIVELMGELNRGETHRKKLHNYIQELRGNIRVYCRVKPTNNNCDSFVRYPEEKTSHLYTIELLNKESNNVSNNSLTSSIFHFDRVFTETSSQESIFTEIKPFIQSALDGDNVCIFAYGATGSGKTYTMQGPCWSLDDKTFSINEFSGVLPRTAVYIFEEISRINKINSGSGIKVCLSAFEIYNENIYDLFEETKTPMQLFLNKNIIQIKNLKWKQIKSKEDIINYTKEASNSRRSDCTSFNENSSRSHAVYQLRLENTNNNSLIESYINIVDLAGSERSTMSFNNKSKEEIELMKRLQSEANFINKSLCTLGRVISMLADKKANKLAIPFRESKLTMILQNSLKNSSKTVMIVTVSSDAECLQQSKDSLKFAKNAMVAC